jgi:hypothetical protein
MNLMEFKIAVIGTKLYGDLGLIIKDPKRPPQTEKGFHDDDLTNLLTKGTDNFAVSDIVIKDKEGRQSIQFRQMKELAEEYLTLLAVAH